MPVWKALSSASVMKQKPANSTGCCHAGEHEQQEEEVLALEAIFAEAFTSFGKGRAEVVHSPHFSCPFKREERLSSPVNVYKF